MRALWLLLLVPIAASASVTATWNGSNYLEGSFGPAHPFLVHVHAYCTGGTATGIAFSTGATSGSNNDSTSLQALGGATARAQEVDSGGGSSNATTANTYSADTWFRIAAAFVTTTDREAWLNDDEANKGDNTGSRSLAAQTVSRIGVRMGGDLGNSCFQFAEISVWNITGFSEANRNGLVDALGTVNGSGEYPDARTVNEQSSQAWTGALIDYWKLADNTDLTSTEGARTFSATGTVSTGGSHPSIAAYGDSTGWIRRRRQ